jgi:hypothetical protein
MRRISPGVVFAAVFLLTGVITAQVVTTVGSAYAIPAADRLYADRAADANAGKLAVVGLSLLIALSVVAVLVYAVLTPLTARGLNPARVLTWVTVGLTVPVGVALLALGPYSAVGWYRTLTLVTTGCTLLFAVVAAVLLALPGAHPYFRRAPGVPPRPFPLVPPPPAPWPQPQPRAPWPPRGP